MTTHTVCDDSDYDGEALQNIDACSAATLVKGEAENVNVYEKYIRHVSPAHQKLFAIIQEHPEPDFYPPRAFPEKYAGAAAGYSMYALAAAAVVALVACYAVYAKR